MDESAERLVEYHPSSPRGLSQSRFSPDGWGEEDGSSVKALLHRVFHKDNVKPFLVLLLFIGCGTVETVDYSLNGKKFMINYLTVLNTLVVAVATIFFCAVVWVEHRRGYYDTYREGAFQAIKDSPRWFFANISVMSVCDTFALYMAILASREVTAPLRNTLQQGNIPITMILSRIFLRHRYHWSHLGGAALIVGGCALTLFQLNEQNGDERHDTSNWWWAFAFFLSCIPMSISICLKEHVLNHPTHGVDMHIVNACVAGGQLILGLALCPVSYMVNMNETSVEGLGQNLYDGLTCAFTGSACNKQCAEIIRVSASENDVCPVPTSSTNCGLEYAPASVWLYILVCCLFNMLMLWVISTNTAVLYFVALATIIPIVSLLSTSALYDTVGLCTVTFDFLQIVGLLTVVLGIVVYRLRPEEEMDPYTDDRGDTACIYDDQSVSDRIMNFAGVSSTKKLDPDHQAEPTPHDTPDLLNSSFQSWDSRESGHKDIKSVGQHEPTPTSRTSGWDQHAKDIDRGRERMAAKKSKSSKAAQLNSSFNHPLIDGLNPVSRTPSTG